MSDVLPDQIDPVGHHGMPAAEQAHLPVQLPHHPGYGRLSGTGVTAEHGVHLDAFVHGEATFLSQLQELNVDGVVPHLLLDLVEADEGVQLDHDVFEAAFAGLHLELGAGALLTGQPNGGRTLQGLVPHYERYGSDQLPEEDDLGGVVAGAPQSRIGGAPSDRQLDLILPRLNGLQPADLPLGFPGLVLELGEDLELPVLLPLQVLKFQLHVHIARIAGGELPQESPVVGGQIVVRAFVEFNGAEADVVVAGSAVILQLVGGFAVGFNDVEVLTAHLGPKNISFPVIGAGFPETARFLVAPPFPQVDQVVEATDLPRHLELADLPFLPFCNPVADEVDPQGPIGFVKKLIVQTKFGVDVARLVAVEDLAVLLVIVPQVLRGIVHLKFFELKGNRSGC